MVSSAALMSTNKPIIPILTQPPGLAAGQSEKPTIAPVLSFNHEPQVIDVYNAQAPHNLKLNQQTGFWDKYNKQADAYDKDLVKALALDLDTLLIFVSPSLVISSVLTGFLL